MIRDVVVDDGADEMLYAFLAVRVTQMRLQLQRTHCPCPVSQRLAKQKFSTWGFPINPNEADFFA